MNIIDNLKEFNENFKKNDAKTIQTYKYMVLGLIVVDMIGVYWFLQWKSGGIAFFIVLMGDLTYILLHERRLQDNMVFDEEDDEDSDDDGEEEVKEKPKPKPKKKPESNQSEEVDFELPTSEEYNKRMDKAFGTFG